MSLKKALFEIGKQIDTCSKSELRICASRKQGTTTRKYRSNDSNRLLMGIDIVMYVLYILSRKTEEMALIKHLGKSFIEKIIYGILTLVTTLLHT